MQRTSKTAGITTCAMGAAYALAYVVLSLAHEVEPCRLFNLLLSLGVVAVCALTLAGRCQGYFAVGTLVLIAAHVFLGQQLAPDNLTSGAILLAGIVVFYVGLKIQEHLSRWHLLALVAGYVGLYWLFVIKLSNAEPLFILYLLALAACARSLRLTAYFWAVVLSFSFCQPYAWESLIALCFLLMALFGARGQARSLTTLIFLAGGLIVVLSLLLPILAIVAGQDFHSLEILFRDARIRSALGLTLATAAMSTIVLLLSMTPLAYALSRLRFPGRELLLSLIDLPIVIPQSAAGIALLCLLGRKQYLGGLLADHCGVYCDGTVLGICLAQVFVAMPFMAKSALAAFESMDEELEYVAGTLGAPPLSVFWRVALPLAAKGVAVGAVLAFARAAGEFGALVFLAPTPETAPIAVFNRFNSMGMAEAAPLVSLLLVLSLGMFFLLQVATRLLPAAQRTRQFAPERY